MPARAAQVLQVIDKSPGLVVKHRGPGNQMDFYSAENAPPQFPIISEFVAGVATLVGSVVSANRHQLLPDSLHYFSAAAATSSASVYASLLQPMAAREQQLSALLAQCSEAPAVVEAALQHGTLCKAARMFVLLNQLTANDVVAVVKQLAMDEQAAVKLWPPECIAWWNDSNKQRRMTARASYRDRSWTFSWKYLNAGSFA